MGKKTVYAFNNREINISTNLISAYITYTGPFYKNPFDLYKKPLTPQSDFIGFIHTVSGQGKIDTVHGLFNFSENDAIVLNVHDCISFTTENNDWHFFAIWFRVNNLNIPPNKIFNIKQRPQEREYMEEIINLLQTHDYFNCCKANTLAQLFLLDIFTEINENKTLSPYAETMQKVASYIHCNINENLSIKELASICAFSENHFCNIFKEYFKISPKAYIIKAKLEKALFLLTTTSTSIANISNELSFYSPAYFTSCFKKFYGKTPSQVRKSE